MRRIVMSLMVWAGLGLLVQAQELVWQAEGGGQLTIKAQAQEQRWLVWPERILVAAIVDGKLVVQEFSWPPGPNPPDPGPGPNPPPPPPPPPPDTKWQVAIFVESNHLDNLTPDQKTLLASLLVRKDLGQKGHRLVGVMDPDGEASATEDVKPWFSAAKGKAPCVALAPMAGGQIKIYPLPESPEAFWRLLEKPPQEEKQSRGSAKNACLGGRCR